MKSMNEGCIACDLLTGRKELPGGIIYKTKYWAVDHCIGPLPVGTLIIKPLRHVLTFPDLTKEEAKEYGPLLYRVSGVVKKISKADQVYICLWSHVNYATGEDFSPGHIHVVVQPAWNDQREKFENPGPYLQVQMFSENKLPPKDKVENFCEKARSLMKKYE
jgi:diadenosine tetraphosphate (Ap4A) HIT family hydrolase